MADRKPLQEGYKPQPADKVYKPLPSNPPPFKDQAGYRAPPGGTKPAPPTTGSGVSSKK